MPEVWKPNPGPQTMFLRCPLFEALFGGAAGGGKSIALLLDAVRQINRPRYRALLIRRSYPELRELINRSLEIYPLVNSRARYFASDKLWRFPSGAVVEFGYVERDDDVFRYQGQEYSYVGWDEATHYSEFSYLYLMSRVRTTDPLIKCYVRATANPGGPHHGFVKARFIDPAPPLTVVRDPITEQERVFIPSLLKDNPHLAQTDYGKRLLMLPEADRKALLEGDWDAYTGSVFKLLPGVHVWTKEQFAERTGHDTIPADWKRYRSLDWGYAKPFACYWYAVDYTGRAYVYREWYGVKIDRLGQYVANEGVRMEAKLVAEKIRTIEETAGEKVEMGVADPSIWAKGRGDQGDAPSIAEEMATQGVYWTPGKNDRIQGKQAMHRRLMYGQDKEGNITDYPGLIFVKEETPHALRTVPALEYDKNIVEDVATDGEDHSYDSLRYFTMSRPWSPRVVETVPVWLAQRQGNGRAGLV